MFVALIDGLLCFVPDSNPGAPPKGGPEGLMATTFLEVAAAQTFCVVIREDEAMKSKPCCLCVSTSQAKHPVQRGLQDVTPRS